MEKIFGQIWLYYEGTELGSWFKWTRYISMIFLELRLKSVCDFMIQVSMVSLSQFLGKVKRIRNCYIG